MKQYILLIHPTDFVRGGNQPIETDAEVKYILANSFEHAEFLAANMAINFDSLEYDVFEIPKAATWCGIDISPKPDALVFDAIDTPTEPGKYFYRKSSRGLHDYECFSVISILGTLFVDNKYDHNVPISEFNGQWYKEKKV